VDGSGNSNIVAAEFFSGSILRTSHMSRFNGSATFKVTHSRESVPVSGCGIGLADDVEDSVTFDIFNKRKPSAAVEAVSPAGVGNDRHINT
jgi:hypothetical protein